MVPHQIRMARAPRHHRRLHEYRRKTWSVGGDQSATRARMSMGLSYDQVGRRRRPPRMPQAPQVPQVVRKRTSWLFENHAQLHAMLSSVGYPWVG